MLSVQLRNGAQDCIHLVEGRTSGTDFGSAAYLYWVAFWFTFPLDLAWLHWMGAEAEPSFSPAIGSTVQFEFRAHGTRRNTP